MSPPKLLEGVSVMNVIGKILVILNLLVALVVAFFIVIVNRTTTNWKAYAEAREREIKSLTISLETSKETEAQERNEKKLLMAKLKDTNSTTITSVGAKDKDLQLANAEKEALKLQLQAADINAKKAQEDVQSYIKLAADRLKAIEDREAAILAEGARYRDEKKKTTELRELVDRQQLRNESLEQEYRKAQLKIQELLAQGTSGSGGPAPVNSAKKPNDPNPPPKMVRGKIEKIHKDDRSLVQIDVGLDQGVDKNHTLEVIRLGPEPQYIGMIRIIDADFHSARGRLIRGQFAGPAKTIREGDQVVSSLDMVK